MRICTCTTIVGLAALSFLAIVTPAQERGKYNCIEVSQFDIQPGVDFPSEYLSALMGDVVTQLSESHKFQHVYGQTEKRSDDGQPCLRLTGIVIKFKRGNRGIRYALGPVAAAAGMGKSLVVANANFTDSVTGKTLYEQKVDGKVIIGVFGGSSNGAARGLAKEIAKVARKRFF